jgi:Ran GTPase-activating protein (RanGAP) involved in mRNA processing and transport
MEAWAEEKNVSSTYRPPFGLLIHVWPDIVATRVLNVCVFVFMCAPSPVPILENSFPDALFDALCRCSSIRDIYWCSIPLPFEVVSKLSKLLRRNGNIQFLSLYGAKIGDASCAELGHALAANCQLSHLTLQNNQLTAVGVEALANALHLNSHLRELNLSDNWLMRDDGALALARMLQRNNTIESLNISNCSLKNDGVRALTEALRENKSLRKLSAKSE